MEQAKRSLLPRSKLPKHVAVIMDGNGRWAKARMLPRLAGHKKGVETVRNIVQCAGEQGIAHLSLFAFSSENWNRPEQEVEGLTSLFMTALTNEVQALKEAGVRLRMIGDTTRFSKDIQGKIEEAELLTASEHVLNLNVCVNYGGRWDIVNACKRIVEQGISSDQISEEKFSEFVQIPDAGEVDLLIRTGGESRISNFFLWQSAYSELYFTSVLWPDFSKEDFIDALTWYSDRERRFGKTSEQVQEN